MSRPLSCGPSLGTIKSSGETDHLSFPFIDPHVRTITARLLCGETALQFAENTILMSYRFRGARMGPGVTPAAIFIRIEIHLFPKIKFPVSEKRPASVV
jgi:hypothetical protein